MKQQGFHPDIPVTRAASGDFFTFGRRSWTTVEAQLVTCYVELPVGDKAAHIPDFQARMFFFRVLSPSGVPVFEIFCCFCSVFFPF